MNTSELDKLREVISEHPDWGRMRIAKEMGITPSHAYCLMTHLRHGTAPSTPGQDDVKPRQTFIEEGETARAEVITHKEIRTVDALMEYMEVDPEIWECEKLVCNKWDMGYVKNDGKAAAHPLFQIKAFFKRKTAVINLKKSLESVKEAFLASLREMAPVRKPVAVKKAKGFMLELAIADLHFGKLCWGKETGGADWDTNLVRQTHDEAVSSLLRNSAGWDISQVLLPIGNDFFHVDNGNNTTTAGTPVDVDTRWQKSFVAGREMMVRTIDRLRGIAPVHIVMVRGNHDAERLFYLGDVLSAWYHNDSSVSVDNSPTARKYFQWGKNLIGFAHGKEEGMERLPMLMATEARDMFGSSLYWEWQLGHLHHKKKVVFFYGDEAQTVRARIIPSLCPPDAWHALKGFNNRRAAEAYVWDRDGGIICETSHYDKLG